MNKRTPIEEFEGACDILESAKVKPDSVRAVMGFKGSDEELVEYIEEKRAKALDAVAATAPKSETEFKETLNVLLDNGEVEAAKATIALGVQKPREEDPVIQLCDRWMRTKRVYKQMNFDDGSFNSRESNELTQICDYLEKEMFRTDPTTPVGVARLLDVYWCQYGREDLIGTEGWEANLNSPQTQLLRRIRNGAARVAGYDEMMADTPDLGIHEDW